MIMFKYQCNSAWPLPSATK